MKTLAIILCGASLALAALPNTTHWDVRATANADNLNGGGYDSAVAGTDMSLYDNRNAAACTGCQSATNNISTTDAVANGTTTISSDTGAFTSAITGNIIYLAGGTGSLTAARYKATYATSTTITVDRVVAAGTGITMNIGGAFATIDAGLAAMVVDNVLWVKKGSYAITTGLTTPSFTNAAHQTKLAGYNATHGDVVAQADLPVILTNAAITALTVGGDSWKISNIAVDCAGSTRGTAGIALNNQYSSAYNVKVSGCDQDGITSASEGYLTISVCEVTGNNVSAGTAGILIGGGPATIRYCYIHANGKPGIRVGSSAAGVTIIDNVIANNTGAGNHGISVGHYASTIQNNTIYGNGGAGIYLNHASYGIMGPISGNLLAKNGTYGIDISTGSATFPLNSLKHPNAFWDNTTAATHFLTTDATDVLITGAGNDPFMDAASADFRLNATTGKGALLRGTAFPGTIPGLSVAGALDFGALQHADPTCAGGAGGAFACVQ